MRLRVFRNQAPFAAELPTTRTDAGLKMVVRGLKETFENSQKIEE